MEAVVETSIGHAYGLGHGTKAVKVSGRARTSNITASNHLGGVNYFQQLTIVKEAKQERVTFVKRYEDRNGKISSPYAI